jgi:hypothetical protein
MNKNGYESMNIKVKYERPRQKTYDVFIDGERIKPRKQYSLKDGAEITLVEQNVVLSKWWWFLIFLNVVAALFGANSDFEEVASERRIIKLRLFQPVNDVEILVSSSGNVGGVRGVGGSVVLGTVTENCPLVSKRIRRYKIGLIIGAILVLTAFAAALAFSFILK